MFESLKPSLNVSGDSIGEECVRIRRGRPRNFREPPAEAGLGSTKRSIGAGLKI